MLLELIKRFGIAGVLGMLVGIALMIWIEPHTLGGQVLVVGVGFLVTVLVVAVVRLIWWPSGETVRRERE